MFTLYYAPNTCALASHIALVEAGAPYTLKPVDFGKTEQGRQHYRRVIACLFAGRKAPRS